MTKGSREPCPMPQQHPALLKLEKLATRERVGTGRAAAVGREGIHRGPARVPSPSPLQQPESAHPGARVLKFRRRLG